MAILAAQSVTGSITGTATDPSGAVVANVKVTAIKAGTNPSQTLHSVVVTPAAIAGVMRSVW